MHEGAVRDGVDDMRALARTLRAGGRDYNVMLHSQAGAIQACSASRTTSTNSVVQQSLDFSRTHVTSYEFVMPAIRGARDLDANRPKAFMSTKCTHFRTPGRGAPHSEHVDGKRMQMCKLSRRWRVAPVSVLQI